MSGRTRYAPLTEEQRQFAAENHFLIERYLRQRKLDINEWYDVVVFRYLLAVKAWFERPELHRWSFSTIARQGMRSAVGCEHKKRSREIKAVSLDTVIPGTEDLRLMDTVTEENLNFVIYVEGEEMNIKYNVDLPERKAFKGAVKSDEVLAIESFMVGKMRNMCFEYEDEKEAKRRLASVQAYRRTKNLKELYDVYRSGICVYIVRLKGGK